MAEKLWIMQGDVRQEPRPDVATINAGTVLRPEMNGEEAGGWHSAGSRLAEIAGRRLQRDVVPDRILRWGDLTEE